MLDIGKGLKIRSYVSRALEYPGRLPVGTHPTAGEVLFDRGKGGECECRQKLVWAFREPFLGGEERCLGLMHGQDGVREWVIELFGNDPREMNFLSF